MNDVNRVVLVGYVGDMSMTELHHRATWDVRIREVEMTHPRAAAWIAEALELGEQAVREKNALQTSNAQRLAEQREKIRTLEDLVESLAKRVLAANSALDVESERRLEGDRRVMTMQASLSGATEAAQISAEAAAAGRQALTVAMRRAESAEQEKRQAQQEAREALAAAVEAASRAENLSAHVQVVERRHAELLGHDPVLHSDMRSSPVSSRLRTSWKPEPEPVPEPDLVSGASLLLTPASAANGVDGRPQSPTRCARRSPRRSTPGVRSPTVSSINQRSTPRCSYQQKQRVDGVPRFHSQHPNDDTPGVGSYDVYVDTIASSAAAARDTGNHRRQVSPHRPVRPRREISLCTDTAGAQAPHTLAHAEGLVGAKPVNPKTQRCTFNG